MVLLILRRGKLRHGERKPRHGEMIWFRILSDSVEEPGILPGVFYSPIEDASSFHRASGSADRLGACERRRDQERWQHSLLVAKSFLRETPPNKLWACRAAKGLWMLKKGRGEKTCIINPNATSASGTRSPGSLENGLSGGRLGECPSPSLFLPLLSTGKP